MRIGILGHFARNTDLCDGQTVKTRNMEQAILSKTQEVCTVDSYNWKKHPFRFLFRIIGLIKKSDVIIMLPDAGGIKIYPYIVNLFSGKKKTKIYSVVGAWLPSYLAQSKKMRRQLKKFSFILVETETMKRQLTEQGFCNVEIITNFKNITPIDEDRIKCEFAFPLPFAVFSRIMKQKGVSDAIFACDRVNKTIGKIACTLDVYGPIHDDYRGEFFELCQRFSHIVKYKGVIEPSKSVETLMEYYMLLFPTLFYTEGVPGTIIDAFSAGVPVLSSEWESYSDVLSKEDSITYKFGNKEDFYQKLKFCVDNVETINIWRKTCLQSAKKFSMSAASEKIWRLINCDK